MIDRLGVALCEIVLVLPTGVWLRQDRIVLVVPHIQYDQLLSSMFHMIRQNASGNTTVLMRQIEVLSQVTSYEHDAERMKSIRRNADLVLADARADYQQPERFK